VETVKGFLAPLAGENYFEIEGEGSYIQATDPQNFIVCGSSRIPSASLDLIQPIHIDVPFIREGRGDIAVQHLFNDLTKLSGYSLSEPAVCNSYPRFRLQHVGPSYRLGAVCDETSALP